MALQGRTLSTYRKLEELSLWKKISNLVKSSSPSSSGLHIKTRVSLSSYLCQRQFSTCERVQSQYSANNKWQLKNIQVLLQNERHAMSDRPQGCLFNTVYLDTAKSKLGLGKVPTVLAVHGTPGSHQDFIPIIEPLVEKGFRVVALNLPGFGYTAGQTQEDDAYYGQFLEDRFEFLVAAAGQIGLERLDVVVGHSSSCHPLLCMATSPVVKSALFMCSPPGHEPTRQYKNWMWLADYMCRMWRSRLLRPLLRGIIPSIYTRFGFPPAPVEHAMNFVRLQAYVNYPLLKHIAMEVALKGYPLVNMYSSNDPVLDEKQSKVWGSKIGVDPGQYDVYSKHGQLLTQGNNPGVYPRGVVLQEAGHNPLNKDNFVPVIVDQIVKLYESTKDR